MDNSELRGLLQRGPQGEWKAEYNTADHSGGGCWYELQVNGGDPLWYPYNAPAGVAEQAEAAALLIAAAVNELPRLLADSDELAKLRAEIAGAPVGVLRDARGFDGDSISDDDLSTELVGQRVALLRLPAGEGQ
jgi:hypothetical protein